MKDFGKKQKLDPIRTLRLKTPGKNSPETSNRERIKSNYITEDDKLTGFHQEMVSNLNPLSSILNRAQYAKRESLFYNIPLHEGISSGRSIKSNSQKSSLADNPLPHENYSPKKSVFGGSIKIQEPFDNFEQRHTPRDSLSPLQQKPNEDYFFGENSTYDSNFFNRTNQDSNQPFQRISRPSVCEDRSKMKRSSIDFINGVYPQLEEEAQVLNNISQMTEQLTPSKKKRKKRNKKKTSRIKTKKKIGNKLNSTHALDKISEGSEERNQNETTNRRRYFFK